MRPGSNWRPKSNDRTVGRATASADGGSQRRAGRSNREFNPSDPWVYAEMIKLTPISKPRSEAGEPAAARSEDRERVGRRGTAPVERSRAAADYLVAGKCPEPMQRRVSAVKMGAFESTVGADDRQRVLDTELPPWRMICALRMRSPTGAVATGTGWLAGPRTIITAGHHVHHQGFHGGWADTIEVSAGRNRSALPFSRFQATRFAAIDRWVQNADPDFDIGCIQLDRPLGELVGWFGVAALTPAELLSARVNISGYPADRGDGTEQYFLANRILHVGDHRVVYDIDTHGAQAGAPVWIHRTPSAPPVVVAVQAYGTGGTPFNLDLAANSAPRIIPEIFDMIQTWVHEDNSVAA